MPFLNLNYGLVIFEDKNASKNPNIKLPDMSIQYEDLSANNDKSDRGSVSPGQIKEISTSARSLLANSTTEIEIVRHLESQGSNLVRLYWTGVGTAPVFRTNRNIGGSATTEVEFTRINDYVARVKNISGGAWSLADVQVGDYLKTDTTNDIVSSTLPEANQGKEFYITSKGVDFIDFVDNGAISEAVCVLGADFAGSLKVLSQGPVFKADILKLEGGNFNPSNYGKFEVLDVSDDYIEFANPAGVEETVLFTAGSMVVYEYLIGFVHIRATGPFKIKFDDQSVWTNIGLIGYDNAMFLGSVSTYKIQIKNDNAKTITYSIQTVQL
jgi:hypothetical protein